MPFSDPVRESQYHAEYRAKTREKVREYSRAWRLANPPDPVHEADRKRQYYLENSEAVKRRTQKWQTENRDKVNERARARRRERHLEGMRLLGGMCVKCGRDDPLDLVADHLPQFVKLGNPSTLCNKLYFEELKKCQCLCMRCHRVITSERATNRTSSLAK